MAAALQARSQTLLSSAYTKAYGSLTAGANPDAQCEPNEPPFSSHL